MSYGPGISADHSQQLQYLSAHLKFMNAESSPVFISKVKNARLLQNHAFFTFVYFNVIYLIFFILCSKFSDLM